MAVLDHQSLPLRPTPPRAALKTKAKPRQAQKNCAVTPPVSYFLMSTPSTYESSRPLRIFAGRPSLVLKSLRHFPGKASLP